MAHTVLAVPAPALERFVRERTAFYDASFLSEDPGFGHAHITVLAPWLPTPSSDDHRVVASIAASIEPFEIELGRVEMFPDGTIYLAPEPDAGLREITKRLSAAFPSHPPYGGRFGEVAPHLTLDRFSATITPEVVRGWVADLLPARVAVDRIDLQWWANHDCRRLAVYPLGSPPGAGRV